jgi:hypothetical protein
MIHRLQKIGHTPALSLAMKRGMNPTSGAAGFGARLVPFALLIAGGFALSAATEAGSVRGDVVVVEPDGVRSVIPNATVAVYGSDLSLETTADELGVFSFDSLPAGVYELQAHAPGLSGEAEIEIKPAATKEVSIALGIETLNASVTVSAASGQGLDPEPLQRATIDKSTIENIRGRKYSGLSICAMMQ